MDIFTKVIYRQIKGLLIILSFLFAFSFVTNLNVVFAADTKYEKSVEYRIMEDCAKNKDAKYKNDSECVYAHFGGVTNDRAIRDKCSDMKVKEPQKCTDNELLALEINSKYRPKKDNNDNKDNNKDDNKKQNKETDEVGSGSYPGTKCFTGLGGELQEKLCPKDAKYPGDKSPDPSKCYYSSITVSTGGVDLYEESSCDKSTFKIAPAYENNKAKETKPSCEEMTKLSSGWFVCLATEFLSDKMDTYKLYIDSLLDVDVAKMDSGSNKPGALKASWGLFRGVASFLLLAVGILMVLSQAIGGGS